MTTTQTVPLAQPQSPARTRAHVAQHPRWEQIDDEQCRRASGALEFIGRRWSGAILLAMVRGASRFSEILGSVAGLSDRLLVVRLKELEVAGFVTRTVVPTTPVTVRYELTELGSEVMAAMDPIMRISQRLNVG